MAVSAWRVTEHSTVCGMSASSTRAAAVLLAEARAADAPPASHARLAGEAEALDDDQLGMMFMTCHPVLDRQMRAWR